MTDDTVNATLVPLAAELVACIRDYGPDDVAAVLARVPDGRHDALAVVLAAMVDPDARLSELLAWTRNGPVQSRDIGPQPQKKKKRKKPQRSWYSHPLPREHGTDRGYRQHVDRKDKPACKPCADAHRKVERERRRVERASRNGPAEALGKVS